MLTHWRKVHPKMYDDIKAKFDELKATLFPGRSRLPFASTFKLMYNFKYVSMIGRKIDNPSFAHSCTCHDN